VAQANGTPPARGLASCPAAARPVVSVIVVNYNGLRFLPRFFDSMALAFERHSHELIVVDNASSDASVPWLRKRAQRTPFRLVALRRNTGFTAGNHAGAAYARGQVLLLINNDTEWRSPLDALVDTALQPDVGAAGCQLRYADGRLQHSIGLAHTAPRIVLSWLGLEKWRGAPSLLRKFETDPQHYARAQRSVDWVSGACLATRREVWDRVGGLDEALFMYCEDVDYGQRVRDQGLRVAYLDTPVVTHHEGGGKAWVGPAALLRTVRSYYLVTAKGSGAGAARAVGAGLAALFALRSLAFRGLAGLVGPGPQRTLRRDKATGFGQAALAMGRAAWTGQPPPLP
jgi:GT2 family glycosyltransferase